jgi:CRISPR/Cas system CMR subunit Cmr6 (Cas7 group RAMP superfamily)
MPLPHDTAVAVGESPATAIRPAGVGFRQASRSLMLERFANPKLEKDDRRDFFKNAFGKLDSHIASAAAEARREFLTRLPGVESDGRLYAQLQSRLMVNMAGGVMENAGLCLDRFGLPYIPGSAVKGCARRAAVAALREWCETGSKPGATDADKANLFKAACEAFETPADMLAAIACVFGWCEQDWSLEKDGDFFRSDFASACGARRDDIWKVVAEKLCVDFGWHIPERFADTPWKALPNFSGSISFLPAYLADVGRTITLDGRKVELPELGKLELDVVTVHHPEYYGGNPAFADAPDTEEPVPNVFPAVAPDQVFAFVLLQRRGSSGNDLKHARGWLTTGLETFGLGAKTAAGYGWLHALERKADGTFCGGPPLPPLAESSAPGTPRPQSAPGSIPPPASDYNDAVFRNGVVARLDRPQDYALLQQEIPTLQKVNNTAWVQKLKDHLASPAGKDARKRLRQKDWFPQEWLPT